MADRIKVLIVDDIPETRDHLSKLLGFESDVEVVGAAAGGPEAVEMAAGVLGAAALGIKKGDAGRIGAAPGPGVARERP